MGLVQFQVATDHYAVGDVVKLSGDEQKRVDEYAAINGIKNPYKTVSATEARKTGGSGTVEPEAGEQVDHNGERVMNDPAPQTPLAGDGTVKVQDPAVSTGQVAPTDGDGADVKVTAADRKAAKDAAKRGQAPAQQ